MAGKALAVLSLLVTLLQVRAQINCYPNDLCGQDQSTPSEVSSAEDCCLGSTSGALSYVPIDNSSTCQQCYVVQFNVEELSMEEQDTDSERVGLHLIVPASSDPTFPAFVMRITFQISQTLSTATLGDDFTLGEITATTQTITDTIASFQEFVIPIEMVNDNVPGEKEQFVLEMTSAQVTPRLANPVEVFVNNSLLVVIVDDDVLEIQFDSSEISVNEDDREKRIQFVIANPISVDTHFRLLALTYEQYDARYEELQKKYPNLPGSTLKDGEYDQAELEDFTSREILFTVKANTIETEEEVIVFVVNDAMLEPREEGFRLVIVVNENFTSRDLVRFGPGGTGRQVALFRIDDYEDEFHFGFVNQFRRITEMPGTTDLELPLHVADGNTTEYTIGVSFTYEDSNATAGEDFIEDPQAQIKIVPPGTIQPSSLFNLVILGDLFFEPEEHIVIALEDPELEPIVPYDPKFEDQLLPNRTSPPDANRIVRFLPRTTVITESDPELVLHLNVPKVVREGESFIPNANVSQLVQGLFQFLSSDGTAMVSADYSDLFVTSNFESSVSVDADEVKINADNFVEPNETFNIRIALLSPLALQPYLTIINSPQVVTIIDNNTATIGFRDLTSSVSEDAGVVVLTVVVLGEEELAMNAEVRVYFSTMTGTADDQDFGPITNMELVFSGAQQEINVTVTITDDAEFEDPEVFTAHLTLLSSNVNAEVNPSLNTETVTINDHGDTPSTLECILSDSLNLQTFSNQVVGGHSFSVAEGCEHKLVMTCDEDVVDLEIRVDYFQNDFSSSRIAIVYEGETVIIDEDLNVILGDSPLTKISYQSGTNMVSVLIPEIKLNVTRNLVAVTISLGNTTLPLAGLCGNLTGQLLFPDCARIADSRPGADLSPFKESYKLKPSDQILRGERKECGITVNDTVIGDPLLTVPIYAPGNDSDLHLCYEIHGAADQYFNFISDECTSVNAHYVEAPGANFLNIIDSMSFVAVDNEHICRNISVDVEGCSATVDGTTLQPLSRKRSISTYEENGISVRAYTSRVRISVPNCADNSLVMWVFCQSQSFLNPYDESQEIGPIDMIKFEVTRGYNLKEFSHGLLGQFWNIPMNISKYEGRDNYYIVTISHPSSKPRSFAGHLYPLTWEFKFKDCLYVGNRQGGPISEVDDPNDSVIEGTYQDYATQGSFMTEYKYAVFDDSVCK